MADVARDAGNLRSIPALLKRNAERFGDRPAYREKEYGIWQSWTWSETAEEVEALALGLLEWGSRQGDFVAIIGRNRPYLYWSMVAARWSVRCRCRSIRTAVADEMAYVLDHCGARFVIAGDQEQVDKVMEVAGGLPQFEQIIYLDPRGMRKYDHAHLHVLRRRAGRRAAAARTSSARNSRRDGAALGYDDTCVMLYTSGTTGQAQGRRAVEPQHHRDGARPRPGSTT